MDELLPRIEIEPATPATASVIWLHGLGADGHDFEPIVPELQLPADLAVRFIFPHAPQIPVTVNGGYVMPAWYDILAIDVERKVDVGGLEASSLAVGKLIEREIERGIPAHRIVLAGFSQGGAVAYHTALQWPERLAGLMALSTYLATGDRLQPADANRELPILVCHGSQDPVVPEHLGQQAVQELQALGYKPQYHHYPMEHAVCLEEIQQISQWLQSVLQ
ncbi:MAG: dienelactone hydrolase family protein [Alcanivorax sp.]|nr:dienelactone hydrolase family protein [Alcanivorax sp.]